MSALAVDVGIYEVERVRREAARQLDEILPDMRLSCRHGEVIEVLAKPQDHLPSLKPRRMCTSCGIEEGKSTEGYRILTADPVEIYTDRRDFEAARPFPTQPEEWTWCYGTDGSDAHGAPKSKIGHHHRCKEHS